MRNGDFVWHCKRISEDGDELQQFAKPEKIRLRFGFLTIQPMDGYLAVQEFGEEVGMMWNGIAQPYQYWFNRVKEGDRFYVDGAKPEALNYMPEDGYGCDANAEVVSVRPQNIGIRIILKKIQ